MCARVCVCVCVCVCVGGVETNVTKYVCVCGRSWEELKRM